MPENTNNDTSTPVIGASQTARTTATKKAKFMKVVGVAARSRGSLVVTEKWFGKLATALAADHPQKERVTAGHAALSEACDLAASALRDFAEVPVDTAWPKLNAHKAGDTLPTGTRVTVRARYKAEYKAILDEIDYEELITTGLEVVRISGKLAMCKSSDGAKVPLRVAHVTAVKAD